MRRSLGFQQQCYPDDGMWMDSQAQQQSYAIHEESWGSNNNYHKQFPGMHMKPDAFVVESELYKSKQHGNLGGSHGMFQKSSHGGHGSFDEGGWNQRHGYVHGSGKKLPFGGTNSSQFANNGVEFNSGGQHGYCSEETEYEDYSEEHHGAGTVKMDEMRYERPKWGGDGLYANPYDRNKNRNWKPHGGHNYKGEWTPKGV